jgi:hypothetical protein
LADRAIACCQLASGLGSIEFDTNLWLIWPTNRAPVPIERLASSDESQQPAQVCA